MRRIAIVLMFASSPALADGITVDVKDAQSAKLHFERGRELYQSELYAEAAAEFDRAHELAPSPLLDYNIALCRDRLEQWNEAAAAYERYLAGSPAAPDAAEVRARIAVLRHRAREGQPVQKQASLFTETAPAFKKAAVRSRWPWLGGAGALAFTVVGVGLVGHAGASYAELQGRCAPACAPSTWAGLPAEQAAGYTLLAVGVAGAAVDIGLWIWKRRK